ncbi:SECIS binding protein pelota RNA binding domain containing protein [Cryptosporidium ryanae]|uniref:SECIS binding protein pelota RNA binding domain containing protein n=1 Tax=Cryptosporidium ryanae TaxID=515981 RepID=UPI00351A3120|nr:SECIS binding protein pelota RNA binding domain containing protein [Cryptosporidium ryanae]
MENLLENNFDILSGELFGFPSNNNISYIQFGNHESSNNNNDNTGGNYVDDNCRNRNVHNEFGSGSTTNTATNIKGNRQLYSHNDYNYNYQQHHRHIGHSRSDSILSDIRNNSLGINAVEGHLNGYKGLRDVGISSGNGSFVERNSSDIVGCGEISRGSFDEIPGSGYNSNYDTNSRNIERLDGPFLDIDRCYNSMNKHGSPEFNEMCSYNDGSYVNLNKGDLNLGISTNGVLVGTMRDSYHNSGVSVALNNNVNGGHRLSNSGFVLDEGNCSTDLDKSNNDASGVGQFNGAASQNEGRNIPIFNKAVAMHNFHCNGNGQFASNFESSKNIKNNMGRYSSLPIDEQMMKMGIYSNNGDIINGSRNNNNDIYANFTIGSKGGNQQINSNNSNSVHSGVLPNIPNSTTSFGFKRDSKAFSDGIDGCEGNNRMGLASNTSSSSPNYVQKKMSAGDVGGEVLSNGSLQNSSVSSDVSAPGVPIRAGGASIESGFNQKFVNSSNVGLKTQIPVNPKGVCASNSVCEVGRNDNGKNNCNSNDNLSDGTKIYEFNNVIQDGDQSLKMQPLSNCGGNNNSSSDSRNFEDGDIYPSIDHFVSGNLTKSQILSMLCGENFTNDKQSTSSGGSGISTNSGTNNLDIKLRRMMTRGSKEVGGFDGGKVSNSSCYPKIGNIVDNPVHKNGMVGGIGPGAIVAGNTMHGGMIVGDGGFIHKYDSIPVEDGCGIPPPSANISDTQLEMNNNARDRTNCQFNRLINRGGVQYVLDCNGNNCQGITEETDFCNEARPYWDQRHNNGLFNCNQDMMINMGSIGCQDWKSQQTLIFDRCEFTDDFGGEVLYNNNMVFGKQVRHKYFAQNKNGGSNGAVGANMGMMNNGYPTNNKQLKQPKRRSGCSAGSGGFDVNQGISNSFRMPGNTNGYIQAQFNENVLKPDLNSINRHYYRSGRNGSGGVIGMNTNNGIFNGNNIGPLQQFYGRKTCPPNYPIQGHNLCAAPSAGINNNNSSYRRKSSSNNTAFCPDTGGVNNMKYHGDFNCHNQFVCCASGGSGINRKGIEDNNGQFFASTTGNEMGRKGLVTGYKGTGIPGNNNNGNIYNYHGNGIMGVGCGVSTTKSNYLSGNVNSNDAKSNDTLSNYNTHNELTPSSIAALWAKAMSKTGGRSGFNNRNNKNHASNTSINDNGENVDSVGASTNGDPKKQNSELVTCARFSSFLRNNSGRLHWLRVLYHYLDTVDIKKVSYIGIEDGEKDRPRYMVAIDDIALEAVSKSFDPSECAYWSEPENGAFVHKNIRLAVAHKVGHRTVSTPQNYVNQILTASLDHNVSVLLNTLRAIDDRVRWMSTIVSYKNGGGLRIDLKLNKKETKESNPDSLNNNNNDEFNNGNNHEIGVPVSNSAKNFPGRVFTVGVREAMRCLRHRKLKALIVAPDIEGDGVEGSLRHHVIHILLQAQELNIPTIFALNRHRIGRAMGKHMRMSVLGLLSIRGVEKQFQSISQTSNLLKKLYLFCVENNLPPTEETFKKLSSTISEIK